MITKFITLVQCTSNSILSHTHTHTPPTPSSHCCYGPETIPEQRAPTSLAIVIGFRLSLMEMYPYRVVTFVQVHAFNGALDTFELKQEFSLIFSEVVFF